MAEKRGVVWLHLNPYRQNLLGEVHFPPKYRARMRLFAHIPEKMRKNRYRMYARQLYKGQELGRVVCF